MNKRLEHHCTVGDLLKFIERHNIPMDAPVVMQRVQDVYFEPGKGWDENSWKMRGQWWHDRNKFNNEMMAELWKRSSGGQSSYPDIEDPNKYICNEEEMEMNKEQYIQAWSPVFYKEEPNVLFLDAHY